MRRKCQRYRRVEANEYPQLKTRRSVLKAVVVSTALLAFSRTDTLAIQENATPDPIGTPAVFDAWFAAYGQHGKTAEGWPIDVLLATPDLLRAVDRWDEFSELQPENALMVLTLRSHNGSLASDAAPLSIVLRIDGQESLTPAATKVIRRDSNISEEAHLFTNVKPEVLAENHLIELELADPESATPVVFFWITPVIAPGMAGTPEPGPESTVTSQSDDSVDALETALPSEEIEVCSLVDTWFRA